MYEDIFDAKNACEHLSGFNVCNRYLVVLYYQPHKVCGEEGKREGEKDGEGRGGEKKGEGGIGERKKREKGGEEKEKKEERRSVSGRMTI